MLAHGGVVVVGEARVPHAWHACDCVNPLCSPRAGVPKQTASTAGSGMDADLDVWQIIKRFECPALSPAPVASSSSCCCASWTPSGPVFAAWVHCFGPDAALS